MLPVAKRSTSPGSTVPGDDVGRGDHRHRPEALPARGDPLEQRLGAPRVAEDAQQEQGARRRPRRAALRPTQRLAEQEREQEVGDDADRDDLEQRHRPGMGAHQRHRLVDDDQQPPAVREQLGIGEALGLVGAGERLQAPPREQADRQGEDDEAGVDARSGEHPAGAPAHGEEPLRELNAEQRCGREHQQRRSTSRRDAAHAPRADHQAEQDRQHQRAGGELKEKDEVERLVERRRLAVERPLQHRDDDAGSGEAAQRQQAEADGAPERQRRQDGVDRHDDAARHRRVQEQVRRRHRQVVDGEELRVEQERGNERRGERGDEDAPALARFPRRAPQRP